MSTISLDNAGSIARGRKRRDAQGKSGGKRFPCQNDGCGRTFTRAEHLQRHLLNHSNGEYTCDRCRAHFKRGDLLERHMTRHRQKDQEAGAEGRGVLNTRKRMWKDVEGKIVTKKPTLPNDIPEHQQGLQPQSCDLLQSPIHFLSYHNHCDVAPISPLISKKTPSHSWDDHGAGRGTICPSTNLGPNTFSSSGSHSPTDQRFWSTDLPQPQAEPLIPSVFGDAPFDDIFNPDTASSFNNPFTTMSNYNWLFDIDLLETDSVQQPLPNDAFHVSTLDNNNFPQTEHAFNFQLGQVMGDNSMSTPTQLESLAIQHTGSPLNESSVALVTPPTSREDKSQSCDHSPQQSVSGITESRIASRSQDWRMQDELADIERPISMLNASRSLPIIDELTRAQVLDMIDITQPTVPDGSIVMRNHPLLTLAHLQTYSDLFFTRFNTTYPLIHMSTFDPSEVDTLLLISVLLLGATYSEKDAHQLAVCIHDNIRPQIFASADFSARPELWVLQTILLVECFGKSRAGQKQHDMSHLFHGLLINLIRRSDCQSIRPPTLEDATDDLEDDWRIWCDAEQKKRLAFLCFMWDTQHAVLFCQSLCMSAFELRSNLPCNQSIWEADSAETWHQLRQNQPVSPLFLSCLKLYLRPNAALVPKNLNALSRSLLLHGLMSIAWDMQRRDQTSLGVIESNPLGNWQARLATSYTSWYEDYEVFCAEYIRRLPSSDHFLAKEFETFRAATLALYRSAHILLYTPFLDVQIYAGARHILGRPVARNDYVRSQRVVKKWVAENPKEASRAVWHAASLIMHGIDNLDGEPGSNNLGSGRLWHHPWSMYLGTLVVWGVWYAQPTSSISDQQSPHLQADEDEIIWDPISEMKTLLETIMKSEPQEVFENRCIAGSMGKRGTNCLSAVVSRCLSRVRWAVVHDGMMVLRGLVQWRLVGGGGLGGM